MEDGEKNKDKAAEQKKTATEQVKSTAQEVKQTIQEKAADVANQAQSKAGEWSDQVKEKTSEAGKQVAGNLRSSFEEQKGQTADQVQNIASALRNSGQELRSNNQESVAQYTDLVADQVEQFSDYVRNQDLNGMLQDVRNLAQRQPELFVTGSLAAGFLLGRFLKSTSRESNRSSSSYGRGRQSYPGSYQTNAYSGGSYESGYSPARTGENIRSYSYEENRIAYGDPMAPAQGGYSENPTGNDTSNDLSESEVDRASLG